MTRFIRIFTLSLIAISALLVAPASRADYKPLHPEYTHLVSRALGMGNATTAWIDDGNAIFFNPAGLGHIRKLTIAHSHSRLHFPGDIENLDQLDADPTSFIVPLAGLFFGLPLGSAGTGFILQGEYGYDYRTRNSDVIPEERLWALGPIDRLEGAGFHLWPGGYLGFTHRKNDSIYVSGENLPDGVTWRKSGEGYSAGIQQAIINGLDFGYVYSEVDSDYLPFRDDIHSERTKSTRTGWSIKPTAWLRISSDTENIQLKEWHEFSEPTVTNLQRKYFGVEIKVGPWLSFRWGNFDGHRTSGWSYHIGPFRSDSAWVYDFMGEMIGSFNSDFDDYHPTGFNLGS